MFRPVITIDRRDVLPAIIRVADGVRQLTERAPRTVEAVDQAIDIIRDAWGREVVIKAPQHARWYVPAIVRTPVESDGRELSGETFVTPPLDKRAVILENGEDVDFDMKAHFLATSLKVRVSKAGNKYLIIPMQHGTDSLKSIGIYNNAKALSGSKITGFRNEGSQQGATSHEMAIHQRDNFMTPDGKPVPVVSRNTYKWGEHLKTSTPALKNYDNMYRFEHTQSKVKNSSYITFRTMSNKPGSSPWIRRKRPGMNVLKAVIEEKTPIINQMISDAVQADLKAIMESISAN